MGNGYNRFTTSWQGPGISLDVVNDGRNNKLQLAPTGDYGGQYWRVAPAGNGYYRLTTKWQGPGKSLDVADHVELEVLSGIVELPGDESPLTELRTVTFLSSVKSSRLSFGKSSRYSLLDPVERQIVDWLDNLVDRSGPVDGIENLVAASGFGEWQTS